MHVQQLHLLTAKMVKAGNGTSLVLSKALTAGQVNVIYSSLFMGNQRLPVLNQGPLISAIFYILF